MVNPTTYVQSPTTYQSYATPVGNPQTTAWPTVVNTQPQAYTSPDAYTNSNQTGYVPQQNVSLPQASYSTQAYGSSGGYTLPYVETNAVSVPMQTSNVYTAQTQMPIAQNQAAPFSPDVPNLLVLNISQADLQWAAQLEQKIQTQGYQPTPQEVTAYQNIANQLQAMRENVRPMTPVSPLPLMTNYGPAPQVQQQNNPQQTSADPTTSAPTSSGGQVTMSEIEWALTLEDRVQNRGYQPTPDEEKKYQDVLMRFKANPKIKMGILDALTAQAPWIGANVATIKFSKPIGDIVKGIKNGGSIANGLKGIGINALKSTGLSAVVSGGFSAVTNAIAVWKGEKTKEQAIINVASDTVSGAVTGLGATAVGGIAMGLAGGLAGWPLMLVVGGASVLGGYLADKLYTKSGAKDWVKGKVTDMVYGKSKPPVTAQPGQGAAQTQAPQQTQQYQQTYTYQQPQNPYQPNMTSTYGY